MLTTKHLKASKLSSVNGSWCRALALSMAWMLPPCSATWVHRTAHHAHNLLEKQSTENAGLERPPSSSEITITSYHRFVSQVLHSVSTKKDLLLPHGKWCGLQHY